MPKDFSRTRRVGEQLHRELSELIRDELKDPRLGIVTINAVEVTRDLGHAKVYFTRLGEASARADATRVLNHAAGFLRRELGRRLSLRIVPQLRFYYDDSVERGSRLSHLIDEAVASDRAKNEGPES